MSPFSAIEWVQTFRNRHFGLADEYPTPVDTCSEYCDDTSVATTSGSVTDGGKRDGGGKKDDQSQARRGWQRGEATTQVRLVKM